MSLEVCPPPTSPTDRQMYLILEQISDSRGEVSEEARQELDKAEEKEKAPVAPTEAA